MRNAVYLLAVLGPTAMAAAQVVAPQSAVRGPAPLIQMFGHELYCASATAQSCLEKRFVSASLSIGADGNASSTVSFRGVPGGSGGTSTRSSSRTGSGRLRPGLWSGLDFALAAADLESAPGQCNPLRSETETPASALRFSVVYWRPAFPPRVVEFDSAIEETCSPGLQSLFSLLRDIATTVAQASRIVEPL